MSQQKDSTTVARDLLNLGAHVVKALKDDSIEALDLLDEYTENFDKWQKTWSSSGRGVSVPAREHDLAKRVAQQHEQVLELTEKMYRSVQDSLKGLRGRAKGIRAYLDQFPSRISTIRTRKG